MTVLIENPYDPHNVAAVLRSAEAMGLLHVHVVLADEWVGFSRRVTQNADKWIQVYLHRCTADALAFLRRAGFVCLAALPPEMERAPDRCAFAADRPLALCFGNEHQGLSQAAIDRCQGRFHLPIHGLSESYNLSVSAALAIDQATQAWRRGRRQLGDLPKGVQQRLRAAYYVNSVRHATDIVWRRLAERAECSAGETPQSWNSASTHARTELD